MNKNSSKPKTRKRGLIEIAAGVGLAAIGGLATAASYNAARPGESYTVYTGIIALGVVYACKGLYDAIFPNGFKKSHKDIEPAKTEKAEATADDDIVKEED